MYNVLKKLIVIGLAIAGALTIINCQVQQRKCNIDVEELKPGEHRPVYYQYEEYQKTKTLKNN